MLGFGSQAPELKLASAKQFTAIVESPETEILNNIYYPRVLLATSGCIGAGLDCDQVHLVLRLGFPCSVIDLIQEMGRCGRGRTVQDNDTPIDFYHLVTNLSDYIYLNEHLFLLQIILKT